ncbi:DUF397 domain-containing protein [Streptomyces avicenniae]|uniref:DUF397 domain-containing protein n=1 Tax=Streptomyces avicenniae TaxID=500153 RepID=UPI000DA61C31|nr:DUF397 domain-containing protein [Streptomyces avicenniae]
MNRYTVDPRTPWLKSSYSNGNGDCVEVASLTEAVAMRDSKQVEGAVLNVPAPGWKAFIAGVTEGSFTAR